MYAAKKSISNSNLPYNQMEAGYAGGAQAAVGGGGAGLPSLVPGTLEQLQLQQMQLAAPMHLGHLPLSYEMGLAGMPALHESGMLYNPAMGMINPSVKHPLQNTWTLWYLEVDRNKSWEEMQNEITNFDTVEDFWSLHNHIKPPSEIKTGSDYSLFKKGIRPMWEDPANMQGGRWIINLAKFPKSDLDSLWLDVLLCLIGEAFDHSDEICGAVVNIRAKSNKISVWTSNGNNTPAIMEIGQKLIELLHLGRQTLNYQLHQDTMAKAGSHCKFAYAI